VEAETRRIVDECYARAIAELIENRDRLDRVAVALLEHETLDQLDVYRVAGVDRDGERPEELKDGAGALSPIG
jgi:cell division protease FtsH